MIEISNTEVMGWEAAIRGMRNPLNSWDKSDSRYTTEGNNDGTDCPCLCPLDTPELGANDYDLMRRLAAAGSDHAKYRRMIAVYADVVAPLYFFKEYDTYKVGTVANSCSTMHKIAEKEFTLSDFSTEQLMRIEDDTETFDHIPLLSISPIFMENIQYSPIGIMKYVTIPMLNLCREKFLKAKENGADGFTLKRYWWQMIQLLPSSYNQRRTIMVNYEVLANMYHSRKNHKLDEWREFCKWIESLPYSELITGGVENDD